MQAVMFAAGRGSRMGQLTDSIPKSMLRVGNATLLEYKLAALPENVDEVIFIVSYLGHVIHDYFGGEWGGRKILYVEQASPTGGTADALWQARDLLRERFFAMNGDCIVGREDMEACAAREEDWAVLVQQREHVATGLVTVENGLAVRIAENSEHHSSAGYANTGFYYLDRRIFDYTPIPKAPGAAELGLPQTMMQAVSRIPIHAVPAHTWFEIKTPEDLQRAEQLFA